MLSEDGGSAVTMNYAKPTVCGSLKRMDYVTKFDIIVMLRIYTLVELLVDM